MSREAFVRSEDKEFEVTFREVRNWEQYSDLDFEADTAPLTEEEAGTHEEDETVISEEWSVVVPTDEASETESEEDSDEDAESSFDPESVVVDEEATDDENADEADLSAESGDDEADEINGNAETGADEEDAETEVDDVEPEFENEVSASEVQSAGTSQESVVTLPVVEDNFDMGPAWEEDEDSDEDSDEEELPVGESAEDTEFFGSSLESAVHADESDASTENVIYFDPMKDSLRETFPEATHYDLSSVEPVNFDPFAFVKDNNEKAESDEDSESIDTFEAISSETESLNKADTVEEIAPEYSEDTLPETVAIEAVDAGDYFSFDGIELDSDEAKEESEPAKEEVKESDESDEDSDDEALSLELDYSDED
jgi:hypothetical protein